MGYWDPECDVVCGDWQGWQQVRTDIVPFKFLYEGALLDFSAGREVQSPIREEYQIDVSTTAPAYDATYNHSLDANPFCNGWNLLEDLPAPAGTTNLADILAYLEPMHSAVTYESSGGSFYWNSEIDDATNPLPMVAHGVTPINSSLLQAYDWYRDQVTIGDWAADPYEECRQWYVILITDGDESCEFSGGVPNPTAVCEPGQAASKFANPPDLGVAPLPVYTIGFSETISEDSPLGCIAEQTGGTFLTATNASQLSAALYDVFYTIEGGKRSFAPFKIAPPPSSLGGNPTRDYLAIFPFFQPLEGKTLWAGNLWAYRLNREQMHLPTTGDCEVDTTQAAWEASSALAAQLAAHTEGDPQRFVYMGSDHSGAWQRYDLATMPDDETLRTEFKVLLDVSGGIDDTVAQQVVNFVRGIYMDDDYDTPGPPLDPRPVGYPVLGDFFHSQPTVINPPNTLRYSYDWGYGNHNYADFVAQQAKRRRVVVAGANDGMLHVFDGGVWNRDRANEGNLASDPYDQIHDLGTGTELFAWVPQAVMGSLYHMTSGGDLVHVEQQYMVDGPIAKSDAFIDHDGDGNREWRTVVLASMRRGGRGILALDLTQPDPIGAAPDYIPGNSKFAGCREAGVSGCSGEYPKLLWEFTDTADANGNGQWDLGWTWSTPAIARIAVYNPSDPQQPDDVFVAFFGGGWDRDELDRTGTYFYGVDVATGAVLLKTNMSVDLPGGVSALDSNENGFHDRLYFADSDGGVWRVQYPNPTDPDATGADAGEAAAGKPGVMTRIFDFRTAFPGVADRQEFFTRPVPVPVLFDGGEYTWAVALGSGDRANLGRADSGIDHFYLLVDRGDSTTRGIANLLPVDMSALENLETLTSQEDLDNAFECPDDAVVDHDGWYLSLRDTEKVTFDATVLGGLVYFPTFDPSTATATSPPNACSTAEDPETPLDLPVVCRASGIGRAYKLSLICGQGGYTEFNDIATSQAAVDVDGEAEVWTGLSGGQPPFPDPSPLDRSYTVTNWRQE
jgi:Tfp pilus tip-associated adhesin PilY1